MLFGPIRAVVIDDEPVHLLTITNGLSAAGIPCAPHWFNRETSDLVPPLPQAGYKHIRLVFMDLNLQESVNPDPQNLFYTVVDVLKKVIAETSGPYVLVFWTQVDTKADEVKELFYEPGRLVGIPHPLEIKHLRKGQFLPVISGDAEDFRSQMQSLYEDIAGKTEALKTAVAALSAGSPLLSTLSGWESRASEAAAEAINSITVHAREDAGKDHRSVPNSIAKILGEIAYEAVGKDIAMSNPARALDAGMVEILVDQFNSSVEEPTYSKNVHAAIGDAISGERTFRDPHQMAASLNTYFHIDSSIAAKATDRGVVLAAGDLLTRDLLGKNPIELIESEFVHPVSKIIKALKPTADTVDGVKAELKASLASLKEAAKLVLVEVGADCDHAQAKPRTKRYLIGLEVPIEHERFVWDHNNRLAHEALQCLGPWRTEENGAKLLLVSCRRYWTWQQSALPIHVSAKYRLRSSIVNKLLHHYTVWSNRPGIVAFRSRSQ